MHRRVRATTIPIILLGVSVLASVPGCSREDSSARPSASSARPVLAASVFPVADLARRVAGDRWDVVAILPPGASPHDHGIRPVEAASLRSARVLVAVGGGLDDWAVRAARGINRQIEILVLVDALGLAAGPASSPQTAPAGTGDEHGDHDADHEDHEAHEGDLHVHEHSHGVDPHIWLDPLVAGRIAERVAAELSRLDPAGKDIYQRNLGALQQELAALDREYREALSAVRHKTLVVFHPGYGYIARRYGLEQVPVMGLGGATPARIEQIVQRIRRENLRAIYREPQYQSPWVETLQRRSGAEVLVLDPLGHAGKSGYDSYVGMMRSNLAVLKEGLGDGS